MATSKVTLKLLINKKEGKVLFAEANKDFVDFLFSIFSLPFGSIIKLLKNKNMVVGCLGDLHQSIQTLSETYFISNQKKNSLLNPKSPIRPTEILLLLSDNDESEAVKFYRCSNCHRRPEFVADTPHRSCRGCGNRMNSEMIFVSSDAAAAAAAGTSTDAEEAPVVAERGFVKDELSYMVMDNLEVEAMSTVSCITILINKFSVENLGSLEEKVVDFGLDEGLKLLKASMESKNVLTSVFLGNMEVGLGTIRSLDPNDME